MSISRAKVLNDMKYQLSYDKLFPNTKNFLGSIFSVPRNSDVATSQAAVTPYHVYSTPCTNHSRATGMMGLTFCPFLTYFTPKIHNECPVARFSVDRIHCLCIYGHLLL